MTTAADSTGSDDRCATSSKPSQHSPTARSGSGHSPRTSTPRPPAASSSSTSFGSLAEFERDLIRDRTLAALTVARPEAASAAGHPPYRSRPFVDDDFDRFNLLLVMDGSHERRTGELVCPFALVPIGCTGAVHDDCASQPGFGEGPLQQDLRRRGTADVARANHQHRSHRSRSASNDRCAKSATTTAPDRRLISIASRALSTPNNTSGASSVSRWVSRQLATSAASHA